MPGKGSGKGGGERSMRASQSEGALLNTTSPGGSQQASAPSSTFVDPLAGAKALQSQTALLLSKVHLLYSGGHYEEALQVSQRVYELDAFRTDNLLLLGAIHFQLRNFSESIFYNQQCVRVDPNFAEGYSNLGNALKELGDVKAAVQFYLKAIKLKPRFCDAYNNLASSYVQLGQMAEAVETYQMALVLNPALVDAHSNLGNLYKAQGDLDAAKRCYLEAIRIKPDFAVAWSNLAGVFKDEGQLATAIAYYKEAIRLCPEFADAHSNLGNALKDQGLLDEAMGCYKASVALRPDFAIAHGNLGSCQFELGDVSGAIKSFKYAIQLEPNFPDAFNNLGNAYKQLGRLDDSIQAYRTALRLKPDHPHAYNNLGNAMKDAGLVKEALHCYVTAIRLLPLFAAAHSNLASVLKEQGKLQQAISHYQEAISIDPLFADAYSNLGNAYKDAGQVDEAIKCYITALKIRPTFPDALTNMAAAYKDAGNYVDAAAFYRQALEQNPDHIEAYANLVHTQTILCDWSERDEAFGKLAAVVSLQLRRPPSAPVCCVQPFHTLAYPLSLDEMQQIACQYAEKARNSVMLTETHFTVRGRPKSARLRVGFVSSDFGNHPLGQLTSSVYGLFDRSLFHVVCYATTPSDMSLHRQYIEATAETFKDISLLSAGDAAQLIYNDDVHVLVNLNGFTRGARNEIFALRPAPLQLSFLGFCGTMGARYMDYLVADATVVPKHLRPFYTEKILSLPHCYLVTDHKQSARSAVDQDATGAALPTRAQYGIPEDKFVFCNFSQTYKITPEVFTLWMNILKRVPNSVLWLLRFPAAAEANLRAAAQAQGVLEDQLVFTDAAPREEHLQRGFLADLSLDTTPCNGHTTTADVLWGGTPIVTLVSDRMASRVSASLLAAAGLPELAVSTPEEYEDLAVSLAQDPDRLFAMRRHLENCRESCAAFDTARWVRNFQTGLEKIWSRLERKDEPEHVEVVDEAPVFVLQEPQLL